MTDKPENPPAFPLQLHGSDGVTLFDKGMTLCDYFAAAALNALPEHMRDVQTDHRIKIAEWAYGLADAMLAARQGGGQ